MSSKFDVLAILTLCLLVGSSTQQECVPQSVENLVLYNSHVLTWTVRPNETCEITAFQVYIFHPDQPAQYAFTVDQIVTDVSFLEVCEEWIFAVVPISLHTMGPERRLIQKLPIPAGANLAIAYLNVNHNADTGRTHLHWDLVDTRLENCSLQYRVSVEESGSPFIQDVYVDTKSIDTSFLASCVAYQFSVRAINTASPTIEGPIRTAVHLLPGRRQHPPVVLDSEATASTISLSFGLESFIRNPCPLRQLYIDGESQLSQTIDLSDADRWRPLNVTITSLQPSTTYNLHVYVSNTAGWSNGTEISIKTLDL